MQLNGPWSNMAALTPASVRAVLPIAPVKRQQQQQYTAVCSDSPSPLPRASSSAALSRAAAPHGVLPPAPPDPPRSPALILPASLSFGCRRIPVVNRLVPPRASYFR